MPLSDFPQTILFLFFLALFVLIGIYPVWQRSAAKIRKFLETFNQSEEPQAGNFEKERAEIFAEQQAGTQLNDFEIFILRRLAQSNGRGLTRKQLNADLHLEPATIKTTLESLLRRGLIRVSMSYMLSLRFHLSEDGHDYAVEQDYIPRIHGFNGEH